MKKTQVPQKGLIQLNLIQQQKKVFLSNMMNFYPIVYEEQGLQDLLEHQVIDSNEQLNYYEYDQSQQHELEQLNTFDGYLQEEPVLLFNYVEEAPKKKSKQIIRRSKKIRRADSETEVNSVKQEKKRRINNDVLKLQQCQKLKTIISQMESLLQLTRTKILNQYIKSKTQ